MKIIRLLSIIFLSLLILSGCSTNSAYLKEPATATHFLAGNYVSLSIYNKDKEPMLEQTFDKIFEQAKKLETNEQGISEIDMVNNAAGIKAVEVSHNIYELVKKSKQFAQKTNGTFNPAIGSVSALWHIGFTDARVPSDSEIAQNLPLTNFNDITLDEKANTIKLEKTGMKLELGGVSKSAIATEALSFLKENDVTSAVLDMGGHLYVLGDNPHSKDGSWTVNITNPQMSNASDTSTQVYSIAKLKTTTKAMVTTSKYSRVLEHEREYHSHLLDSATGKPTQNDLLAVTVVGNDATQVDLLSNALYSMGLEEGRNFINKQKGIEAIFVTDSNEVHASQGLKDQLTINDESNFTHVE
ncbi:MAG: FAD:protein FMN transferase [Streptococcaceae bacterium]|jgi:thiamine biosynthesis lipoprotein|nr:FAD:protein FMN transferase [Streptococcaceae bacterium]